MKTAKFILPVTAITAAVAGALATGNSAPIVFLTIVSFHPTCNIRDGACDQAVTTKKCRLASGYQAREYSMSCAVVSIGSFVADQPSNP
jgi:hypothetical protein